MRVCMPDCLRMDCAHTALFLFMHKAGGGRKAGILPFLIGANHFL